VRLKNAWKVLHVHARFGVRPVLAKRPDHATRQRARIDASDSIVEVVTVQQPPADLLITITPGIRTLVETAASLRP
jgi:hypothetical protein